MTILSYNDLEFEEMDDFVKVTFYHNYYFNIKKEFLKKISSYNIKKNSIEFESKSETSVQRKFDFLLTKGFTELRNKLNNRKTVYIHQNSGIPLMGSIYFGIIDRGSNLIEVRPVTGCNLNCIYCSVDEGKSSKKDIDFVVEPDYLVSEFRKLAEFKGIDVEAHINAQGEPLLYPRIVELVKGLSSVPGVKLISLDTNGSCLTKELIDKLADAGLTRFNLSLNAVDTKRAEALAGMPVNLIRTMELAEYITKKMDLIITPLWVPGYNDEDIPKLIEYATKIGAGKNCPPIGIQNFLNYRFGRNPVKGMPLEDFFNKLKEYEKQYGVKLITATSDFKIIEAKSYPKPFKKGEVVEAQVVCPGRLKWEQLAVSKDRVIAIPNCDKHCNVKVRISRTKHNIFIGNLI